MLIGIAVRGTLALVLAVTWEALRSLTGADWFWSAVLFRLFATSAALVLSDWAATDRRRWLVVTAAMVVLGVAACWWDLQGPDTRLAWLAAVGLFGVLLSLESAFACDSRARDGRLTWLEHASGIMLVALAGGVTLALLAQIESKFAEEEFFVALQAAFLTAFSLLLLLVQVVARQLLRARDGECFRVRPIWGSIGLLIVGIGFVWWNVRAYQVSFYAPSAPGYKGISDEAPFLCAALPPESGSPAGEQVYARILDLVARNPHKDAADLGMLALTTGELRWAYAFRAAIVAEAEAGAFTEPAGSVKYGQRLAALRLYYVHQIQATYGLFSELELATLRDWFAAINRRALTVEWVDLMYSVAFSTWPEGPYENQETGAGLLALMEASGLGDSALSEANRDYLARHVRGWALRFRNTDDAYSYQSEWLDNAYFQEIYRGRGTDVEAFERRRRLAFEWLLLQALPGGEAFSYNRPGAPPMTNAFYLGALMLDDPRYVWVADQSLTRQENDDTPLHAQPGLDHPVALRGTAPTQGSCLLFSPTGLPTQVGPLAPDKIVFRDGWSADAMYMLLNLRFTGWHRYKATNSVVMLYQDEPLVVEDTTREAAAWLPTGRSHFRDKRIPREHLNGLLVPRSGFSQVVYSLSGMSGPWAQDPPHHARVDDFARLDPLDSSRTTIVDWRGWSHQRSVYFIHRGPVIVVDEARGPGGEESALVWHLSGKSELTDSGILLRSGDAPVRVALSSDDPSEIIISALQDDALGQVYDLTYLSPDAGQLNLVSAFLMNGWDSATLETEPLSDGERTVGQYVHLSGDEAEILLLHNGSTLYGGEKERDEVSAAGMSTDGLALLAFADDTQSPHTVCLVQGSRARLSALTEPSAVRFPGKDVGLARGKDWDWEAGELTVSLSSPASTCLEIVD